MFQFSYGSQESNYIVYGKILSPKEILNTFRISDSQGNFIKEMKGNFECWTKYGNKFIYLKQDSGSNTPKIYDLNSNQEFTITPWKKDMYFPCFECSPSGDKIALCTSLYSDNKILIYDLVKEQIEERFQFQGHPLNIHIAWAFDESKLIYSADNWQSYSSTSKVELSNVDGTSKTILETDEHIIAFFWSPSIRKVLFYTLKNDFTRNSISIYLYNLDDDELENLTEDYNINYPLIWLDQDRFLSAYTENQTGICIFNTINNKVTYLTKKEEENILLKESLSPNKDRIAYVSTKDGNKEIYTMNIDGTNKMNLTKSKGDDESPIWSPDGKKILFISNRDGNQEIYVMNADGTEQINLSKNKAKDYNPRWSSDGSKIAFISERDGNKEVYVVDIYGSNLINISKSKEDEEYFNWQPARNNY